MNGQKQARMQELVKLLNQASKAYYQDAEEIMSNYEYDKLYDELLQLENELGITLSNSPTVNVGYEVLSELPKERHESPMLSLDKTKEAEALKDFLGEQNAVLSWKMDGLTIVLTYRDGELYKAVTRGNGEVGEVITNNAKVFKNVPLKIQHKGELTAVFCTAAFVFEAGNRFKRLALKHLLNSPADKFVRSEIGHLLAELLFERGKGSLAFAEARNSHRRTEVRSGLFPCLLHFGDTERTRKAAEASLSFLNMILHGVKP